MRKYLLGLFVCLITLPLAAQLDTASIAIANHRLHDGTFSWRGTGTWFDRTTWNSTPYTEGHLKRYNGEFRQNFRLLIPQGYDPNYEPGYPIMVVWHGGGERANCWGTTCYYGNTTYNPNTAPIVGQGDINNLLNNDHNLAHGGSMHLDAWNQAGTKKVGDPSLSVRAFPGFVVFPQMLNGWNTNDMRDALRIVRLLMKKYNIDQDRVYSWGLSYGGRGLLNGLVEADWMFAAAATMSAITPHNNFRTNVADVAGIPMWMFQGGQDTDPTPAATEQTVAIFKQAGGDIRYTLYPTLGHGTWNTAYNEQDFFPFFLGRTKRDIHVAFGVTEICPTTGAPVKLSVVKGLYAYQWERNGVIIPGATTNTYDAALPGVYRARFSRVSATPTEEQWNQWSDPVTVTDGTPVTPVVTQVGSIVLRDLNNGNVARLVAPEGASQYSWYKDGVLTAFNTNAPVINAGNCTGTCTNAGTYTVITSGLNGCPSPESNAKTVFFSNQAPVNIPKPTGFTGSLTIPTSILLRWNDVSGLERNYELWRRKSTDNSTSGWTFVALLDEDDVLYEDKDLSTATEYWYKIRAVSNTGRSDYAPGNSRTTRSENLIISTGADVTPPSPPQNLSGVQLDTDIASKTVSLQLSWTASPGNDIKQYIIKYGNTIINTNSTQTSYVISGLPLNQYYYFTVSAQDINDNVSDPSNQAMVHTYIDGFFWYHGTGAYTNFSQIPATVWTSPEFTGKSTNATLDPRTQEEFFTFKFYGYVYIPAPGTYYFRMRTNDGVQLYVNGVLTAQRTGTANDGTCATANPIGGISFTFTEAGPQSIEIRYFQYTGDKCLTLQWRGPGLGPNPNGYYDVPDARVRSYDVMTPPFEPLAPENLVATATGMTSIDLSWVFNGAPPAEYEIYRSTSAGGTYSIIDRVGTLNYTNQNLAPNTTYYYKLKTVTQNGTSPFSEVVSATTFSDSEAPTAPTNLVLYGASLTTASIGWTPSTDNSGVTGYEVWVNGVLHGTTQNNYYEINNLLPFTNYGVYVIAFDGANNKSPQSNTLNFSTSVPIIYYSKPGGNLNDLATWGQNIDGSGTAPANFSTNGTYFTVANRAATTPGGTWKVEGPASKIIVASGVTLTLDSPVTGNMEVADGATLIMSNATEPTLVGVGLLSTIQYNQSVSQVQQVTYGDLILTGNANKTFAAGNTTVMGNLTIDNNVAIKGGTGNSTVIQLHGDLTFNGTQGFTPSNVSVALDLRKNGVQNLNFSGAFEVYSISTSPTTQVALNSGTPGTVTLGADMGGGLSLASGSTLTLGGHTLNILGAGTINSGGQTGIIHTSGGSINLTSTSAANSNLYFDATNNQLFRLTSNLTGTGTLQVASPAVITDGLKVSNGTLNANGNITLLSTAAKTANLEQIEGTGQIVGAVNAQRYFNYKANTYRYISSPVEGMKISGWQQYFSIAGDFTGASGSSKRPSLYTWEPTGWVGYPLKTNPAPYNDNQAPIVKGEGYAALIRNTAPFTLVNTGVPHQGNVVFSLFPDQPAVAHTEWNLLGNPYASTIMWSLDPTAWISQEIGSVVAIRNNSSSTSGQFMYFDGATGLGIGQDGDLDGGRIAPGQAFYVMTTGPNPQLTITEKAKGTGQQSFFREDEFRPEHLRLRLTYNSRADEALIIFSKEGSQTYNASVDGAKMANIGLFNIYTWKQSTPLAINHQNKDFCEKILPVSVSETTAGTYSLTVESAETLSGISGLTLIDHFTSTNIDLFTQNNYTFTISSDPKSYGMNRFELKLTRPSLDTDINTTVLSDCETSQVTLQESQQGVAYQLLRADGTPVSEKVIGTGSAMTIDLMHERLTEGNNDLTITASFEGCSSTQIQVSLPVNKITAPKLPSQDISMCYGSKANLVIPVESGNIAHYQWADSTGIIKSATGPAFTTGEVTREATYFVTPILTNGCKGNTAVISVSPQLPQEPEVFFANDTLYSTVLGSNYSWTRNGETIEGSNAHFLVPSGDGVYDVTVVLGGCEKTSRVFNITGIDPELADVYQLYPNPTTAGNITVHKAIPGRPVAVRLTDVVGRDVYSDDITPESESFTLKPDQAPSSGVYFLLLDNGTIRKQIRFIVRDDN